MIWVHWFLENFVINIFGKDRNLSCFAIYFYKINILPSTLAHLRQYFANLHAIMGETILTCYFKNEDNSTIAATIGEPMIYNGSVYFNWEKSTSIQLRTENFPIYKSRK